MKIKGALKYLKIRYFRGIIHTMRFERDKHLHSREHLLADDLSKMLGEPGRFAAYLGIAKLYHESDLRGLAKYVLEKENLPLEARGKYFFGAVKNLQKIPGAKLKPKKKKEKAKNKKRGKQTANRTRTA